MPGASASCHPLLCVTSPRTLYPRTRAGLPCHEPTVFQTLPRNAMTRANAADAPGLRTYLAHGKSRHRPCGGGRSCGGRWRPVPSLT